MMKLDADGVARSELRQHFRHPRAGVAAAVSVADEVLGVMNG